MQYGLRGVREQKVERCTPCHLLLLLLLFCIEVAGPENLWRHVLRGQLLPSSLLIFVYQWPLGLIFFYWFFVYKHPWLYPVIIERCSHFSLKASIFFIWGAMQLLLDLLQLPHQVEFSLRTPQIEHSVLISCGNHPTQASFRVYLRLHRCGEALSLWCEHARWADATGDPIWWKLPAPAHREHRVHLVLLWLCLDRALFFPRGEIQKWIQEFLVRDLKELRYQLIYVDLLVAHPGLRGSRGQRGLVVRISAIWTAFIISISKEYSSLTSNSFLNDHRFLALFFNYWLGLRPGISIHFLLCTQVM